MLPIGTPARTAADCLTDVGRIQGQARARAAAEPRSSVQGARWQHDEEQTLLLQPDSTLQRCEAALLLRAGISQNRVNPLLSSQSFTRLRRSLCHSFKQYLTRKINSILSVLCHLFCLNWWSGRYSCAFFIVYCIGTERKRLGEERGHQIEPVTLLFVTLTHGLSFCICNLSWMCSSYIFPLYIGKIIEMRVLPCACPQPNG